MFARYKPIREFLISYAYNTVAYLLIEHKDKTVSVKDEEDYDGSSSLYPKKVLPVKIHDEGGR